MAKVKNGVEGYDAPKASQSSGGVTAANYVDRALGFIKGRGGVGFVIRAIEGPDGSAASEQPATEPQWIAWMQYFADREISCAYLQDRGVGTVPCEWPEDFDYEARTSDRGRLLPRKQTVRNPEAVARVVRGFGRVVQRFTPERTRPTSQQSIEEMAAYYRNNPAELSAEARSRVMNGYVRDDDQPGAA